MIEDHISGKLQLAQREPTGYQLREIHFGIWFRPYYPVERQKCCWSESGIRSIEIYKRLLIQQKNY